MLGDQTINIASEAEGTKTTTESELVLTKVEASTRGDFACTVTYTVEGQNDFQVNLILLILFFIERASFYSQSYIRMATEQYFPAPCWMLILAQWAEIGSVRYAKTSA